jgi:acetoin utilization deacetylase AcuC-like enzyme
MELTAELRELARELGAPLGFVLEGGYDLRALSASVAATMETATGGFTAGAAEVTPLTAQARSHYAQWWNTLRVQAPSSI